MIHPGMPRIPAVDKDGKLLWDWRKELSRRRSPKGTVLCSLTSLVFIGFLLLVREALPPSAFEPHLDASGAFGLWIVLSLAFTALTAILVFRLGRAIQGRLSTR